MAKRRTRGTGCVYQQRGSKVWWMVAKLGTEMIRETTGKLTKTEAVQYLDNRLAENRKGEETAVRSLTLADLYAAVEKDYQLHKRDSLRDIHARWVHHLEPEFGARKLHTIRAQHVTDYQHKRQQEGAMNGSINRELALFRRCYLIKVNRKRAGRPPAFDMLPEAKPRAGFLSDDEFESLKTAARGLGHAWLAAFIEVAGRLSNRKSELLNLLVEDCNFADGARGSLVFHNTKNGDDRRVLMTPSVHAALAPLCAQQPKGTHVFRWSDGRAVRDFRDLWKKVCTAIGKPDLLVHDLRRTAVRNMVRKGLSEQHAMEISGHKTREVFRRYNITSDDDRARNADLIG